MTMALSRNFHQFDNYEHFVFSTTLVLGNENNSTLEDFRFAASCRQNRIEYRESEHVQGSAPTPRSGTPHEKTTLAARWISAGFYVD